VSPRLSRLRHGIPVYRFDPAPDVPPVSVIRFGAHQHPAEGRRHIHDFPLLLFTGTEVLVLSPGQVVDPTAAHIEGDCATVIFDPSAFDGQLLVPFREAKRVAVPDSRIPFWWSTIASIEEESDRSRIAVVAYATLLLVELGRMVPGEARDPAVEAVLDVITERFPGELSLRDVAAVVGLTPGYLTTMIRERTGRTVQQWITEYRLAEARRLLADSSIPVAEVARRVGLSDPAYFTRVFRRGVGATPTEWRSGARHESAV
jgi:AraC family transcriptional activator of pobA